MKQLDLFDIAPSNSISNVVNVASIPQRSPFRYPGGKTWFVPTARKWFDKNRGKTLIEPFCGGAIISLTAVMENWFNHAIMIELDEDVAAVWKTIFFVDPPYTAAGKRLYNYHEIDHDLLFQKLSEVKGDFILTYDDVEEIRDIANSYGLQWRTIPMQTTHLVKKEELIISNNFDWI